MIAQKLCNFSCKKLDRNAGHPETIGVANSMVSVLSCELMIRSFRDAGTADVFNGKNTPAARKVCPLALWKIASRKLDQLDSVTALRELNIPPGNRLEALSGDRHGQHSIRINDRYRLCFIWTDTGPDEVEIVDYH